MRRSRGSLLPVLVSVIVLAALLLQLAPAVAGGGGPGHVLRYRAAFEARLAKIADAARAAARTSPARPVLDNFTLVGRHTLGATDATGDVWVHENTAYLGTWVDPCNGLGVKVVDVTNPREPGRPDPPRVPRHHDRRQRRARARPDPAWVERVRASGHARQRTVRPGEPERRVLDRGP